MVFRSKVYVNYATCRLNLSRNFSRIKEKCCKKWIEQDYTNHPRKHKRK